MEQYILIGHFDDDDIWLQVPESFFVYAFLFKFANPAEI